MYAKWRIFVYQVATFAGVGGREGLGHRDGAERRAGAPRDGPVGAPTL
jgi:hypothetical protein